MAKPPLGGWGSLRGVSGVSCMLRPHIAQTIKEFEKGLHTIFPHSSFCLISFVPLASSGLSISPLGPNDLAKRPHLKAHSGRTRTSKSPFCKAIWAGRPPTAGMESPLQGVGGAVGGIETKKGKHRSASLAHAKIQFFQPECKCGMKGFDTYKDFRIRWRTIYAGKVLPAYLLGGTP